MSANPAVSVRAKTRSKEMTGSYKATDFASDQQVRWCPGCGDYSILAQMKKVMPEIGVAPENTVFVSGIGCSSRFPYYMNTYGMHGIHGRAPAISYQEPSKATRSPALPLGLGVLFRHKSCTLSGLKWTLCYIFWIF